MVQLLDVTTPTEVIPVCSPTLPHPSKENDTSAGIMTGARSFPITKSLQSRVLELVNRQMERNEAIREQNYRTRKQKVNCLSSSTPDSDHDLLEPSSSTDGQRTIASKVPFFMRP